MRVLGYVLVKEEELQQLRLEKAQEARAAEARADACAALRAHLATARESAQMSAGRYLAAENTLGLQARSIEQLMASNERMVKLVSDMRRTGYGILEPIQTRDVPETVDDVDREAVERNPALGADDE